MINPCIDFCKKLYSSSCDTKCDYARSIKENNKLKKLITLFKHKAELEDEISANKDQLEKYKNELKSIGFIKLGL